MFFRQERSHPGPWLKTHNVHIARPIADFVVSLGTDGRIKSQGSLSNALAQDRKLAKEVAEEAAEEDQTEHTVAQSDPVAESVAPNLDGKLIVAEEISEGHVGWPAGECLQLFEVQQNRY